MPSGVMGSGLRGALPRRPPRAVVIFHLQGCWQPVEQVAHRQIGDKLFKRLRLADILLVGEDLLSVLQRGGFATPRNAGESNQFTLCRLIAKRYG